MKQTNNAIKFLMAQYRAIFKSAYFKGLTSAVVLTAGLAAAGSVQAADIDKDNWTTDLTKTDDGVTIVSGDNADGTSGSYNDFKISGSGDLTYEGDRQIIIQSYSGAAANITASGAALTVTGTNTTITLSGKDGNAASGALTIAASGGDCH